MARKKEEWTDTSEMKLIETGISDDKRHRWYTFLARSRETADAVIDYYIVQRFHFEDGKAVGRSQYKEQTKTRKFLCIGGKHAGTIQAKPGADYRFFNTHEARRGVKGPLEPHRSVWIHISLLQLAKPLVKKLSKRAAAKLSQGNLLAAIARSSECGDEDADHDMD
jgi:hypothetical protein